MTVAFADTLRRSGIPVEEVSIGSTPTLSHVDSLEGITEVRPGNYACFDAFQTAIGSCGLEDVAASVLTTVAGHYPAQNKMIIDAGALALSKDTGPRHVDPDCGYGIVCSSNREPLPNLKISSISQEHGQVYGSSPINFSDFPVGSQLRILPNHACMMLAMHDRYHVVRQGQVVEEWKPVKGW